MIDGFTAGEIGPGLLVLMCAEPRDTEAHSDKLVAKILKLQQPGIEAMARGLAEQPAMEMMNRVAGILPQRVAPDAFLPQYFAMAIRA